MDPSFTTSNNDYLIPSLSPSRLATSSRNNTSLLASPALRNSRRLTNDNTLAATSSDNNAMELREMPYVQPRPTAATPLLLAQAPPTRERDVVVIEHNSNRMIAGISILLTGLLLGAIALLIYLWYKSRKEEERINKAGKLLQAVIQQAANDNGLAIMTAINKYQPPTQDLFFGKTAVGHATHDRPVWYLTRDAAQKMAQPDDHGELIMTYGDDYRRDNVSLMILVYANWCGACQAHAPEVLKAAQQILRVGNYNKTQKLHVMVLNADQVPPSFGAVINAYPTILTFDATNGSNLLRPLERKNADMSQDIWVFCKRVWKQDVTIEEGGGGGGETMTPIDGTAAPEINQDMLNQLNALLK